MATGTQNILSASFLQMAYVTNDFDAALAAFGENAGIDRFFEQRNFDVHVRPGQTAKLDIALAYAGGVQIEVIHPVGGAIEIYRDVLEEPGFCLRLHHQGQLVSSVEEIYQLQQTARERGFPIVLDSGDALGDRVRYFYADTRKFIGHYIEYLYYDAESLAFFDQMVPRY